MCGVVRGDDPARPERAERRSRSRAATTCGLAVARGGRLQPPAVAQVHRRPPAPEQLRHAGDRGLGVCESELRRRLADTSTGGHACARAAAHLARPLAGAARVRRRPANAPSRARSASAGRSRYRSWSTLEGRLAERQRDRDEVAGLLDGLAVTSQGGMAASEASPDRPGRASSSGLVVAGAPEDASGAPVAPAARRAIRSGVRCRRRPRAPAARPIAVEPLRTRSASKTRSASAACAAVSRTASRSTAEVPARAVQLDRPSHAAVVAHRHDEDRGRTHAGGDRPQRLGSVQGSSISLLWAARPSESRTISAIRNAGPATRG